MVSRIKRERLNWVQMYLLKQSNEAFLSAFHDSYFPNHVIKKKL